MADTHALTDAVRVRCISTLPSAHAEPVVLRPTVHTPDPARQPAPAEPASAAASRFQ
jgi:hypothetical protein